MEMEETLIDKNEDAIFENGLLELKKNNNRLYIFNLFFSHCVNFFWFGIMLILSYGVKVGCFLVIVLGAMEQW
jgi:hypothetical protein